MNRVEIRKSAIKRIVSSTSILICLLPWASIAQESLTDVESMMETVIARRAAISESISLSPEVKEQILTSYDQTTLALERALQWSEKNRQFEGAIAEAPTLLESVQRSIEQPMALEDPPEAASAVELDRIVAEREEEIRRLRSERDRLEAEPARQGQRQRDIPMLSATARDRVRGHQAQLRAAPVDGEISEVSESRQLSLRARLRAREQELLAYTSELKSYEVSARLLLMQTTLTSRLLSHYMDSTERVRRMLAAKRTEEITEIASEVRRMLDETERLHPEVRAIALAEVEEFAQLYRSYTDSESEIFSSVTIRAERDEMALNLSEFRADLVVMNQIADIADSSENLGLVLRQQLGSLPDAHLHRRNVTLRKRSLADVQVDLIRIRQRWRETVPSELEALQATDEISPPMSELEAQEARSVLATIFDTERRVLEDLLEDYERHFSVLVDLNGLEIELADEVQTYYNFVNENILFIRSGTLPSLQTFKDLMSALRWISNPIERQTVVQAVSADARRYPAQYVLVFLLASSFLLIRHRWVLRLPEWGEVTSNWDNLNPIPLLGTAFGTVVFGLAIPVCLGILGWRVSYLNEISDLDQALSMGLVAAALHLGLIGVAASAMRPDGIAIRHFGWPAAECMAMRPRLRYLAIAMTAFSGLTWAFDGTDNEVWRESAGRFFFIAMQLSFLFFAYRTLARSNSPIRRLIIRGASAQGIRRLALARLFSFGLPTALLILALIGYYYTALHVSARILMSLGLLVAILYLSRLTKLLLLLARRRVAKKQAQIRRTAAAAASTSSTSEGGETYSEEPVDLQRVDIQTERFVRNIAIFIFALGIWPIWASMVPALNILNEIEIGATTKTVTEMVPDADGIPRSQVITVRDPITLAKVLLNLFVLALTFGAARNIPGVLEVTVLQRMGVASGERYAIVTLARYGLTLLGVSLAFRVLGIGWSNLQWLIAAMGIGLGFGLQEIFANFFSGLILLFERPIRLGDTVTVGGINGVVSKIRIRSTTIIDFDRRELVIPNKDFVTQQVINWSLSDKVLRIVIPVGVAYDSDTEEVASSLLEVARKSSIAIAKPEPQALFMGFGDSALDFELRVFCGKVDDRLPLIHEMHMAIARVFKERGIEIAYPQQDIHIRSTSDATPPVEITEDETEDSS